MMKSVLLLWTPSFIDRSKLKGQYTVVKGGCGPSVGSSTVYIPTVSVKTKTLATVPLKCQCHKICLAFLILLFQPIWAPDKRVKLIILKNSFSQRYSIAKFKKFYNTQC